jgi:hypothetical protein
LIANNWIVLATVLVTGNSIPEDGIFAVAAEAVPMFQYTSPTGIRAILIVSEGKVRLNMVALGRVAEAAGIVTVFISCKLRLTII